MIPRNLEAVLQSLADRGQLNPSWQSQLAADEQFSDNPTSWHSRAITGFGAWLSSILFVAFCSAISMTLGGFWVFGILLLAGGLFLNFKAKGEFWEQVSLALSFSGQAFILMAVGTDKAGGDGLKLSCAVAVLMSGLLIFFFESKAHRFISVLFLTAALLCEIYLQNLRILVPILGGLFFLSAGFLIRSESRHFHHKMSSQIPPLLYGSIFVAIAITLISALDIFSPLLGRSAESSFPQPWIATAMFWSGTLYFCLAAQDSFFDASKNKSVVGIYALLFVVACLTASTPGISLALGLSLLGFLYGDRKIGWIGLGCLPIFVFLFIYATQTSLLEKGYIYLAVGLSLLLARRLFSFQWAKDGVSADAK